MANKISNMGNLNKHQKRIINASKIANRCRRNWNYEEFDNLDLQTITAVATNMPTKQNKLNYELVVSTNIHVNEKFYKVATAEDDRYVEYINGQVNAPLLYIWCHSPTVLKHMKSNHQDPAIRNMAVGVSAGAAALAATYLGYETGFCRCYDDKAVEKIIEESIGVEKLSPMLMLGVGNPKVDANNNIADRSLCFLGGEHVQSAHKFPATIKKIHYI